LGTSLWLYGLVWIFHPYFIPHPPGVFNPVRGWHFLEPPDQDGHLLAARLAPKYQAKNGKRADFGISTGIFNQPELGI